MLKKQLRANLFKSGYVLSTVAAIMLGLTVCPVRADTVQMAELSDFSPSAYGIHTLAPVDLWTPSDPKLIDKLLDKIAGRSLKDSERERLRSLLTADTGRFMWPDVRDSDTFLIKRLKTLQAVGEFEAVEQMIQSMPAHQRSAALKDILADVLLLQGKTKELLALLEAEKISDADEKRIIALFAAGDLGGARLQYELYREKHIPLTDFTRLGDVVFRDISLKLTDKIAVTPETIFLWIRLGQMPVQNAGWIQSVLRNFKPELLSETTDEKLPTPSIDNLMDVADLTPRVQTVYPIEMYQVLGQAASAGRRGEAVLWAVLLLSESDFYRVEMTQLMNEMMGTAGVSQEPAPNE